MRSSEIEGSYPGRWFRRGSPRQNLPQRHRHGDQRNGHRSEYSDAFSRSLAAKELYVADQRSPAKRCARGPAGSRQSHWLERRAFKLLKRCADAAIIKPTDLCQNHSPRGAREQLDAEALLQLAHSPRDNGRVATEAPGCLHETSRVGNCDKGVQFVHADAPIYSCN